MTSHFCGRWIGKSAKSVSWIFFQKLFIVLPGSSFWTIVNHHYTNIWGITLLRKPKFFLKLSSWPFFVTFLGWWVHVTFWKGCSWPPTFGGRKVTNWITWLFHPRLPGSRFWTCSSSYLAVWWGGIDSKRSGFEGCLAVKREATVNSGILFLWAFFWIYNL